jgi:hypothetical protein
MAFVDPNQPEASAGQNPAAAQQAPVSAGGAGVAGGTKAAASTPGVNVPAQPSAQLSAYLSANQPQAQAFAQNVAGTVGGQVNAAGNAVQSAANTYTGNLYTVPTDAATNAAVASSPASLTPEQRATFQQELGAAAKVPNAANTFEATGGYQDLTKGVQSAVEQANLFNSGNNVGNLTTALSPFETPQATSGDRTLDALLISQSPDAYKTIQQAVAPAANLQGNLDTATSQADQALRDAISSDNAATAGANQSAQTYAQNLTSYLNDAVKKAQDTATSTNARLAADLASGALTPDDIAALGLSQQDGDALIAAASAANADSAAAKMGGLPIALSNYLLQGSPTAINAANTATAKDYADAAALQSLMGDSAPAVPISAETAGQAGKAPLQNYLDYASALKAAGISDQIAKLQLDAEQAAGAGEAENNAYSYNHAGGVSPDEFNNYIAGINSRINADNSQIQSLAATAPTIPTAAAVSEATGGPDWQHIGESAGATLANMPLATLAPIVNAVPKDPNVLGHIASVALPLIAPVDEIKSVAKSIGSWLGI